MSVLDLKEAIMRLAGTFGKADFKTFDATVISVDVNSRTCVVNSLDYSIEGLSVRFMPEISDGSMKVPQVDSTIVVGMTDFTEPYVVSSTWIDRKTDIVGDTEIDLIDGAITISQGTDDTNVKIVLENNITTITQLSSGKTIQVQLKDGKANISNDSVSLLDITKSIVQNIIDATYVNGGGQADLSPTSLPGFQKNITDLGNLLF